MCDTMVALGDVTADGSVLFAKNSDRHPNEAQQVLVLPAADHAPGARVRCTWIEIPQVPRTNRVLLCKPFWMWGAEMGANEHGLVIGNEAVFTKVPREEAPGLLGMDLIRLALERCGTADEALDLVTRLLEEHGQGGEAGLPGHPLRYDNAFVLADPTRAWVLETAGRQWVAERVRDVRTISNRLTIGEAWDRASAGAVDFAVERGWAKRPGFHFARAYSDRLYTTFAAGEGRQRRSTACLGALRGRLDVAAMMATLRHHEAGDAWSRAKVTGADLCMHAGFGPVRVSQSVGSLVSHLRPEGATHWVTATSTPCTAVFKPVWLDAGLPSLGPDPTAAWDEDALWWRHEALVREVQRDYAGRIGLLRGERDALEADLLARAPGAGSAELRLALTTEAFARAEAALASWRERVAASPRRLEPPHYAMAWRGFDREAGRDRSGRVS